MEIAGITINAYSKKTRNGFAHIATAILPDWSKLTRKVNYLNRTWESYPFQTAVHLLCEDIAVKAYRLPSPKSLNAKKWAEARAYADRLMAECDEKQASL